MPRRSLKPCRKPGCPERTRNANGFCDEHGSDRYQHRATRTERGYGTRWERTRERILRRDDYLCQPCKRRGRLTPLVVGHRSHPRAAQVDHKIPKHLGGSDDDDNLEAICRTCHDAKSAREGRRAREGGIES